MMWLRYAPTLAVAGAALGCVTWLVAVLNDREALRAENASLRGALATCAARSANILEDKESDDAIDRLSDDDLRTVPDGWLVR